jgi:hypothetical protein
VISLREADAIGTVAIEAEAAMTAARVSRRRLPELRLRDVRIRCEVTMRIADQTCQPPRSFGPRSPEADRGLRANRAF